MLNQAGSYEELFDVIKVSGKEASLILSVIFLLIFLSYIFHHQSFRWTSIAYAVLGFIYSLSLMAQAILFKITGFGINREYLHNFFQNPYEDIKMMMLKPIMDWVDENKNQPFFLTYLTLSTHHEYGYPPDFPAKDFGVNNESQNRYLNAVRYTDYFIRKVFEEFKKRNLLDKTIFIILGDHGEAFGEHGLNQHNYILWEEGLRVPGIIYAPALYNESRRKEGFRSIFDIAPTICDLIGLKVVEGEFLGKSLITPPDKEREFFYTGWSKSRVFAYRKGKYKFIFPSWSQKPKI
ncbi:MAG: sulfatase-like hydrolase/transferase [Candidatus Aminicenantes bacterium]|nr:sulfatase-like hydrolase/transferase [Candidatus Aminicenantes bacterium]